MRSLGLRRFRDSRLHPGDLEFEGQVGGYTFLHKVDICSRTEG